MDRDTHAPEQTSPLNCYVVPVVRRSRPRHAGADTPNFLAEASDMRFNHKGLTRQALSLALRPGLQMLPLSSRWHPAANMMMMMMAMMLVMLMWQKLILGASHSPGASSTENLIRYFLAQWLFHSKAASNHLDYVYSYDGIERMLALH